MVVVDESHTPLSRQYLLLLDATPHVRVQGVVTDMPQARERMRKGAVMGIVYLPGDFDAKVGRGETSVFVSCQTTVAFLSYAAMKEAIAKAQMYISTTPAFNNQEKQLMQQFKFIIAALPREKNNLQKIFAEFAKINAKSNVRIVLERGSASLLEFKPGELIYRGRGNEKVSLKYDAMIPRTRTSLFISMEHALKMKNCEFYSDLYHGKIPADSTVPAGFWKQIWPFAKQAL
jgi:hypothetical protein